MFHQPGCNPPLPPGRNYGRLGRMASFVEKRFQAKKSLTVEEKERILAAIGEALEGELNLVFACVHGSFIKEDSFHDVDVGLFCKRPLSPIEELALEELLSSRTGLDVDVKCINEAPLSFQMAVLRDGKLLLDRDQQLRTDFIDRVSRRFRDYAHFRNVFLGIDGLRPE